MTKEPDSLDSCSTAPAWWVFWVRGLEITDWDLDFQEPMFVDSTLVSFGALRRSICESDRIIARHGGDLRSLEQTLTMWAPSNQQVEFSALIAVRRPILVGPSGPIVHSRAPAVERQIEHLQDAAEQRAFEIANTLGLVFMRDVGPVFTSCGLDKAVPDPPQLRDGIIDFDLGLLTFTMGGAQYPYIHPQTTQATREELATKIETSMIAELAKIVLWPNLHLRKKPLRQILVQSVDRLARALVAVDIAERLLGAVTAIEILLATNATKFDSIRSRLVSLLGEQVCHVLQLDRILNARHKYVHEGKRFDKELADHAVRLVLAALKTYVTISKHIQDKTSITQYLDLRHQCQNFLKHDAGVLREHLKNLPFHPQPTVIAE